VNACRPRSGPLARGRMTFAMGSRRRLYDLVVGIHPLESNLVGDLTPNGPREASCE
jgi:hypothetical protein